VNYSKLNKLTTVEALASAVFILGYEELCSNLLLKFNWGHTFLELNENLLKDYQKAESEDEIHSIIKEYGYNYN
jgi:pre-rRNA-processing protein TSR3